MACNCDDYVNCDDRFIETVQYSDNYSFSHEYNNTVTSDDVLEVYQKTSRMFSVSASWDRSITPGYVVQCDTGLLKCDDALNAIPSSNCSEHCLRETNVPYYFDRKQKIYVWKHVKEELIFSVSSTKCAAFKTKWGMTHFHKLCIPTTVRTVGKEQFIMLKDGIKTVLAEVEYNYNPFPVNDIRGGTWGLYGNIISKDAPPDTADVACILIVPLPPKLAIAYDNDVIHYGFYDYNAVEAGFVENSLAKDDGGKDYFYPYWCRSMPIDPLWRSVADQRYNVTYSAGQLDLHGTTEWTPPVPQEYPFPFGSFALDSKENFIASCILQFGEHTSSKGLVYNEASIGDLFAAITKAGVPITTKFTAVFPVTPL